MSVEKTASAQAYVGNNSTTIPYVIVDFQFLDAADIVVWLRNVSTLVDSPPLTQGTQYTVSGNNIRTTAPVSPSFYVMVERNTEAIQPIDYTYAGAFPSEDHENALDRLTFLCQETLRTVGESVAGVASVNGRNGAVVLSKTDVGLGNVDNTSDANKPVSGPQQTALNAKESLANKASANGYASLDSLGKVPSSQLPAASGGVPDDNVVTNAKLSDMATARIKGRVTAGTGDPEDLTGTQATTLLDIFTPSLKGLVPPSPGGTSTFIRADGTWASPPAGGGGGDMLAVNNLNEVVSKPTAFANIKQAASEVATGVVELATQAEVTTGTDDVRAITPLKLATRLASGLQAFDQDLADIAALAPANDDIIQRKSGAWTNRTPTQFKTDLGLNNVNNTADASKPVSSAQAAALIPTFVTLTDGGTVTWTMIANATSQNATVTLAGNRTLAIAGASNGMTGLLIVKQDGTGNRTLALPAGSRVINGGAGGATLSTGANAVDILSWVYDGSNYYWTRGLNYT